CPSAPSAPLPINKPPFSPGSSPLLTNTATAAPKIPIGLTPGPAAATCGAGPSPATPRAGSRKGVAGSFVSAAGAAARCRPTLGRGCATATTESVVPPGRSMSAIFDWGITTPDGAGARGVTVNRLLGVANDAGVGNGATAVALELDGGA